MGDDLRRYFDSLSGEYEFERELGAGGMAVVWLARDLRHHRRVAIKLLRPQLLVGSAHARFLREIGFLAELSHPNILPLLDSGEARDAGTDTTVPFFTMPYVAGESLHHRIAERGPLSLAETVSVVRDVAAALDHAHDAGVVHRDIKPGNILLSGGRAVVADFGIARAVESSLGDEPMTETGMRVGTLLYLAPESHPDRRSDQYSLACVVFEMLTGAPPFAGGPPQAILARHHAEAPPSLTRLRSDCPAGVAAAVKRALAKAPEERFARAGDFAAAIEAAAHVTPTEAIVALPALRRRVPMPLVAMVAILLLLWLLPKPAPVATPEPAPRVDSTRIVLLPNREQPGGEVQEELLRDALLRWGGITVVDPFQAREVIARVRGDRPMTPPLASDIAARLGAGRYILRDALPQGDSLRVRLSLYETGTGRLLGERLAIVPADASAEQRALLRGLVDSLVLSRLGASPVGTRLAGGTSLPALEAFAAGGTAVGQWDLAAAEAAFAASARSDAGFAAASLWLALVRSWLDAPAATWRPFAMRADGGTAALSERDQAIARALVARASGSMDRACAEWRGLTGRFAQDFVAQYGLADCLVHDEAVLRDRSTRSGWRFRAEYGEAATAYGRAFALLTAIYRSLRPDAPGALRGVYQARFQALRSGRAAAPDTGLFLAQAILEHDTIAFVPFPALAVMAGDQATTPSRAGVEGAQRLLHRRRFEAIAAWLDAAPGRAEPLAAMAEALELLGDRTALDTLRRARSLAKEPALAYRLAVAETWLRLRAAIPGDTAGVRRARAMADSLLAARDAGEMPYERAGLAALTGRGALATSLWRRSELAERLQVPRYLMGDGPALLVTAAMGGPADSLLALEQRVSEAIDREFADPDRISDRLRWLAPATTYAWPAVTMRSLRQLRGRGDPVLDATASLVDRDTAASLASLAPYAAYRAASGQYAITLDALPAEARLRWNAGDRGTARALLDGTLGTLFGRGPETLEDPLQAAGLVRGAALRAYIARALGDLDGARRWGTVVRILWSDADAALAPVVREAVTSEGTTAREAS